MKMSRDWPVMAIWRQLRLHGILPACLQHARCTRRRVFVEQRPAGALCRWCSQCLSAADRAARHRNTIRSSQFRTLVSSARILAGIRPSCGLSRRPGSRDPGISVGRSATRNRRPRTSHSLRISLFQVGGHLPIRQPAIVQLSAREDSLHGGLVPRASP